MPHLTCPFEGERYCVIVFTNQSYGLLPARNPRYLCDLGFNWPMPGLCKEDYGTKTPRLCAAAARLPPELASCVCQHLLQKRSQAPAPWAKLKAWMQANGRILDRSCIPSTTEPDGWDTASTHDVAIVHDFPSCPHIQDDALRIAFQLKDIHAMDTSSDGKDVSVRS